MEIDLREIQALHARYAREPVVIDLESLVRARPAPLLLAHDPKVRSTAASPWRRAWDARANVGRGALMVVGGTVLSAAIGMGAAALWAKVHDRHAAAVVTPAAQDTAPKSLSQRTDADPAADVGTAGTVRPLTSGDLDAPSGRGSALSSIDPSSFVRTSPAAAARADQTNGERAATSSDEQRAIASPLRQHILGRATQNAPAAVAPMHIPPAVTPEPVQVAPSVAKPVEPAAQVPPAPAVAAPVQAARIQATAPAHRPTRHRAPAPEQSGTTSDGKTAPAASTAAPHGGDVQLF